MPSYTGNGPKYLSMHADASSFTPPTLLTTTPLPKSKQNTQNTIDGGTGGGGCDKGASFWDRWILGPMRTMYSLEWHVMSVRITLQSQENIL
jgi:hypothetical protein